MNLRKNLGKAALVVGVATIAMHTRTTQAQSVGVGFHLVDLEQGYSLVSNPFQSGSNLVSDLFTGTADGFQVIKMSGSTSVTNSFTADNGWSIPDMTLTPGEGALVFSPGAYQWFTSGKPLIGQLANWIPAGDSLRGSRLAVSGLLTTDLGFQPSENTSISEVDSAGAFTVVAVYTQGSWIPEEPSLEVGKALMISADQGFDWQQEFQVEGIENPLSFTTHPSDAALMEGDTLILISEGAGAEGLSYQWQLNGNDIAGATTATLTMEGVTEADAGQYAVVISTADAALRSQFANVTVEPEIIEPKEGPTLSVALDETGRNAIVTISGTIGEVYTLEVTPDFIDWSNQATDLVNETGSVSQAVRIGRGRTRGFRAITQPTN